jgi:hypothetical protein
VTEAHRWLRGGGAGLPPIPVDIRPAPARSLAAENDDRYIETLLSASTFPASIAAAPTYQRPDLLERAWALPVARLYAPLLTQGITSVCGPTSVANVLRSLQVRTGKNPLRGIGLRAMSLDQLVREAAEVVPAAWGVRAVRPTTLDDFRAELMASNREDRRYVANFTRRPLFGHGGGHHSPLGGFLEAEDLAFVLDVNASYGPWLVSTARLFEATHSISDWSTGTTRGLARFHRDQI